MMRIRHFILSFLLLCAVASGARAADGDWSFSRLWVGAYPSAVVSGQTTSLLAHPAIRAALGQVLPRQEAKNLSAFTTESVVTSLDGFVIVDQCRPHNCAADRATVVIDPIAQKLWVGFFTREAARVSTRWYGSADDYSVLPEKLQADFIARHAQ